MGITSALILIAVVSGVCSAACYDQRAGFTCGVKGVLTKPVNFHTEFWTHTKSALECGNMCSGYYFRSSYGFPSLGACQSIGYNTETKECQFFKKVLAKQSFVPDGESIEECYDRPCFDCPAQGCPGPTGHNLLGNGGFEAHPHSITPWLQFVNKTYLVKGYKSPQAWEFIRGSSELYQVFDTCPGSTYKLSFDWFGVWYIEVQDVGPDLEVGDLFWRPRPVVARPNATWHHEVFLIRGHPNHGIYNTGLYFTLLRDGHAFGKADNFVVEQVNPKPTGQANLITNGGFEHGISPWTPHSASKCKLVSPGHHSPTAWKCIPEHNGRAGIYQILATKPHTTYIVSFDYRAAFMGAQGGNGHCNIFYDWGDAEYTGTGTIPTNTSGVVWYHLEQAVLATETSTKLDLFAAAGGEQQRCHIWIDNVKVVEGAL